MRKIITATDGHILTDGEIYGTEIMLAEGLDGADLYEITLEEYNAILEAESCSLHEKATAEDYQNALKEVGVRI